MTPPQFTRVARMMRKHDTWEEKCSGVGCATGASLHINFVVNIRTYLTFSMRRLIGKSTYRRRCAVD
jgi:hypothetical protein